MPELMGKLDTPVNGPEGLPPFDGDAWERVDWRHHEEQVRRLRGRIFKAVQDGDWPLARNVQKLMLRSWGNTLVSVRQVTQRNTGRRTAGIDGLVALTSQARAEMLLPGPQDPHLGGVHDADEEPGISGGVVGKVPVHMGEVPDSRQILGGDCCLRAGAGRERRGRLSRPGPWSAAGRGSAR